MARVTGRDIEIEYRIDGDVDAVPLLMIMGLGAQMVSWEEDFVTHLTGAGFRVIRFDNRDAGLSTHLDGTAAPLDAAVTALLAGQEPEVAPPYALADMAADAIAVLDDAGVGRAHVMGVSMGGMIAQTFAIDHPERCLSLTSVMSTTGEPDAGRPSDAAMAALLSPPAPDREAHLEAAERNWRIWSTRRYWDVEAVRSRAGREYDRCFYPEGVGRQLTAILLSPSRVEGLASLGVPTLVIHGEDDQLVTPSGGERTAELVPGAHLLKVADMGHDLPRPLWPLVVGAITGHARGSAG